MLEDPHTDGLAQGWTGLAGTGGVGTGTLEGEKAGPRGQR
jgi:hypothetical protein